MYEEFFGLRERPFDLTPNPRYLVLTDAHREVLSNLEYGIASRGGLTLVIGEAGSGKTTLIRTVLARQSDRVHSVHIHNPTLSREEFFETLAAKFDLSSRASQSKAAFLAELEALLRERDRNDQTTVLIIDEGQSLPLPLLEEVRLLANTETNEQKLLQVVLAGQPELAERLNAPSLKQFKQRISLRCELRPLTERETAAYIAGRITIAGGKAAQIFTREAVTTIYEASQGLPRVVSVIADNALLGGFARGERPVSRQTISEVIRDFDLARTDQPAAATGAEARRDRPSVIEASREDQAAVPQAAPGSLVTVPPAPGPGLFSMFTTKSKRFFSE
jgi:general secretion pathway protein A